MANIIGVNPPVLNDEDYVDKIKNSLDSVDAHDHSPGKGVAIPAGALAAGSIDNDDINAAAAIARSKLASGTANHVVVNDASGVMSSEAQLAKTRGGTGVSSTATFPTSGVVVTEDGTQSLTNKTIDADQNTISNIENADIKTGAAIARNKLASGTADYVVINDAAGVMSSEAQLSKTRGGTGISSTATFPSSGVIVTEAGSQTLTNKTIDADQNTISNIENADIKVGAAIDRTKFASGTANHVIINNGSGVMSSEAQLAISRGGTGQSTATLGFNALAPTTTAGDFIVHNGTNNVRQGIGSDGQVLVVDTTQTNKLKWTSLQQGAKNYIAYNNFENNALTGWKEASVTWTSGAPSGAPTVGDTAAASIALSVTATTPLAGSYSLQMVGTIAQGQGFCTDVLSIDREDQAKVLQGSFYYEVMANPTNANWSGTSSNTLCVYIYDVTNSAWIQPAGVYNLVQSSGQGLCSFTFQTPASISQFRLFVFAANTASGSITVNFDDFAIGPQKILSGAAISDWQSYTPTGSWTTNTTYSGQWRRVGDSAEVMVSVALSGAPTGTLNNITLPSGITIDTAKIAGYASNANMVGMGSVKAAGAAYYPIEVMVTSATTLLPAVWSAAGTYTGVDANITATVPGTFANGDFVRFTARFPVSGFSSNTVMSSDTDTRVVAGKAYRSTTQTVGPNNSYIKINMSTIDTAGGGDTHAAWDIVTNNRYVVPVSGWYDVDVGIFVSSTNVLANKYAAAIYKNGTLVTLGNYVYPTAASSFQIRNTYFAYLNAGDYVEPYIFGAGNNSASTLTIGSGTDSTFMSVVRRSGPATIAANELVACRYTNCTTAFGTTNAIAIFGTKDFDTHGFYNSSTGIASIPIGGKYRISAGFNCGSGTGTINSYIYLHVRINSVVKLVLATFCIQTTSTISAVANGSCTVSVNAGDTIDITTIRDSGAPAVSMLNNNYTWLNIERIGN